MNALTPYLLPIKVGAGLLVCALLVRGGCAWQANVDAGKLAKAQTRIDSLETSLTNHIAVYDRMNEAGRKAKADAEADAKAATAAAKRAEQEAREYQTRLTLIQRDLDKAARDPKCRQQLEEQLCVVLR